MRGLTTCLWFDTQAEEAANFYTSLFDDSEITGITRSGAGGPGPEGSVLTVEFRMNGQNFVGLNGGPHFTFDEAISFQIACEDQAEVDHYWRVLSEGGAESQCGWVKDRFGLSWQIVPTVLPELLGDSDPEKARRAMEAMLQMGKLDIATLQRAHAGVA